MNRLKFKSVGVMLLVNSIFYVIGLICSISYIFVNINNFDELGNLVLLFIPIALLFVFIIIQLFGSFAFIEFSKMNDEQIIKNKNRILGWTVATFYSNFIIGIFAFMACYSIDKIDI